MRKDFAMSEYVLISDSASDIDEKQVADWDTPIIPINYYINDKIYENKPDLSVPRHPHKSDSS